MNNNIKEKIITPQNGILYLIISLILISINAYLIYLINTINSFSIYIPVAVILSIIIIFILAGLKIINPNEALVLVMFGKYYGTIKKAGFYFVNPFAVSALKFKSISRKISLKTMAINNEKQKVNDLLGNPILIGAVVTWRVDNPTKAIFNVENYSEYLSLQTESTIRNIARLYPYDQFLEDEVFDENEKTLRGSSQEIANKMKEELQQRVFDAGLLVEEIRITDLSYSEEIAAAMLQRQQATAIIAARKKIVEGAVGMVNNAIELLDKEQVITLDEERKAAMVSNLLVVLCGNKDTQPIINSGNIY